MLIHEVRKMTGLTRKAIEYYVAQGLLEPPVRENGYRDFSEEDVTRLSRIAVLRRLGLTVEEIRSVLSGEDSLQAASVRARLDMSRAQRNQALLDRLCAGESCESIRAELDALDGERSLTARLTEAFPGFYGRYMALHFAAFLPETIETDEQRAAYAEIIAWLDDAPALPDDIRQWLDENTVGISGSEIARMGEEMRRIIADPAGFKQQYAEALAQQAVYSASAARAFTQQMKTLLQDSGYYDVFIPALRRLSPEYDAYSRHLEALNAELN